MIHQSGFQIHRVSARAQKSASQMSLPLFRESFLAQGQWYFSYGFCFSFLGCYILGATSDCVASLISGRAIMPCKCHTSMKLTCKNMCHKTPTLHSKVCAYISLRILLHITLHFKCIHVHISLCVVYPKLHLKIIHFP